MKQLTIIFLTMALINGQYKRPDSDSSRKQSNVLETKQSQTDNWSSLKKYVGTYPVLNDFFKNPIIIKGLKKILGSDYKSYCDFESLASSGFLMQKGNLLYGEVRQLHVGGFDSEIFIDLQKRKMYLFWLTSTVSDKKYKIFGDKPIPEEILKLTVDQMNSTWGSTAKFSVVDDSIKIDLKSW